MYDSLLEAALLETARHSCDTVPVASDHTYLLRQFIATVALILGVWAVGSVRAYAGTEDIDGFSVSATGVQIYDCRADTGGQLSWQFREPLATLIQDGKTVGRHFAGPSWEMADGSAIVGKVSAQSPGATAKDIALLQLDVVSQTGEGVLSQITGVERIETRGGLFSGRCERAGDLHVEPYTALYRFFRR